MAIALYAHNQKAYDAVVDMLSNTGKAAVIHPTGTGKSFVGFKLCEENSDKIICWLSPSEYIFKTQLENLKMSAGYIPTNIRFFTYAKLMMMTFEEIKNIKPDYIILDEFHRCGAEMWGKGVENLLAEYPNADILGLSATNIRYLDNQRDMADELFDGNIASEITLGEAIVRGILNAPKYVQSVYSYEKDLEKYERRVYAAKNPIVRKKGEKYLEALRRAIEKADGLDTIFQKHMVERTGKYIVFCANKEHMDEMLEHIGEWFSKVDKNPVVYTVYSEDAAASQSFADFKNDTNNDHLRLLYAIDALNEGIHVDNISGVILLRPTVSPIVFKQQIGRALQTGKNMFPVVFDIVNNIENLYSIGIVEDEMKAAITYYQFFGDGDSVINDRFNIYDEVKNCKELFKQLDETLSASWDYMYEQAVQYYKENGNLNIPKKYKTSEGYSLGAWILTQRKVRAGEKVGNLNDVRIAKLDKIGMCWENAIDLAWKKYYSAAKCYFEKNGNLNVPARYIDREGVSLGPWISSIRTRKKAGANTGFLSQDRVDSLNELGMIWDQADFVWQRSYNVACEYYGKNGNLEVPLNYTLNGIKLGLWIQGMRQAYNGATGRTQISESQIDQLNQIGMRWENKFVNLWEKGYDEAEKYFKNFGNLKVRDSYVSPSGFKLGNWISNQRESFKNGKITPQRKSRLDNLEMIWTSTWDTAWEERYSLAKVFYEQNGHLEIPADYTPNGIWLNKWLGEQRKLYHKKYDGKSLTPNQIEMLENIGIDWRPYSERAWSRQFAEIEKWICEHEEQSVFEEKNFKKWFQDQKRKFKDCKLTKEQIESLNLIGFRFNEYSGQNEILT